MTRLALGLLPALRGRREHHGMTAIPPRLAGKQLELLKEILPRLTRVGVLGSDPSGHPAGR